MFTMMELHDNRSDFMKKLFKESDWGPWVEEIISTLKTYFILIMIGLGITIIASILYCIYCCGDDEVAETQDAQQESQDDSYERI